MKSIIIAVVSIMVAGCTGTIEKARADCAEMGYKPGSPEFIACTERTTANRRTNAAIRSNAL